MWVSARPKEGVRSGTRVTGHCEIPGMGAENRAQILWENSECSPPLSLLSNVVTSLFRDTDCAAECSPGYPMWVPP